MKGANLLRRSAALIACALIACADRDDGDVVGPGPLDISEERDGLWATDSTGTARRITAMRVAGFDYDSLAAKQREGEVILYWAAAPVAAPDGRLVAYATNREAVARDARGQSIWLLDLAEGSERALLHVPGHSYRPVGWLGDDVVFIGDESGVWLVVTASGQRRRLASGTWLAAADDGSAVAVADDVPADPRITVITPTRRVPVPPAPDGAIYLADASFEEGGRRLLLEAAPDSGYARVRFTFDLASERLRRGD